MGKKNSSKSNYIMQGSILAIASIVSRIIGLLYRLPVTNIITDDGNYYYSAAYEIYNVILADFLLQPAAGGIQGGVGQGGAGRIPEFLAGLSREPCIWPWWWARPVRL